ncbi:MAG: hypothetical protein WA160_08300 [Pseudobdellovibrio sp.]
MISIKYLINCWNNFWFKDAAAENLGLFRIIFYSISLLFVLCAPHPVFQADHLFEYKSAFFEIFKIPLLEPNEIKIFKLLEKLNYVFLFLSAIGFLTTVSAIVSFGLSFYLFGYIKNFGYFHHFDGMFVVALLIMAFASSGHKLSIDALLVRKIKWPIKVKQKYTGEYYWPIQILKILWVHVFFSAVLLKFITNGMDWINKDILLITLYRMEPYHLLRVSKSIPVEVQYISTEIRAWMMNNPSVTNILKNITLIIEIMMPAAMFSNKFILLIPMAMGMLLFVQITLGHPFFLSMAPLAMVWINYGAVIKKTKQVYKLFENKFKNKWSINS